MKQLLPEWQRAVPIESPDMDLHDMQGATGLVRYMDDRDDDDDDGEDTGDCCEDLGICLSEKNALDQENKDLTTENQELTEEIEDLENQLASSIGFSFFDNHVTTIFGNIYIYRDENGKQAGGGVTSYSSTAASSGGAAGDFPIGIQYLDASYTFIAQGEGFPAPAEWSTSPSSGGPYAYSFGGTIAFPPTAVYVRVTFSAGTTPPSIDIPVT